MKSGLLKIIAFLVLLSIISSAGCTESTTNPEKAIEAYFQALIARDVEQLSNLSCTEWESSARTDLDSFTAVIATLENFSCQAAGTDNDHTLITCSGKIVANYGDEILEIEMSERLYLARFEAGEWRMCGYK